MTQREPGRQRLDEHLAECADCRSERLPLEPLAVLLDEEDVPVDPDALSCRALPRLRAQLQTNASEALVRRTVKALLVSIVPMALIVGYDMFLLDLLHGLLLRFLPPGLAAYIVLSYVTFISFIFAATYAAIPLLLARRSASPQLVH
jgi:hypothetical protein